MKIFASATIIAALCLLTFATPARAQDPVKVAPDTYKVLLDNTHMRILEVTLKPGSKTPMHSHPGYAVYAFSDSQVRFASYDGKSVDVAIKAGETMWRDAEAHSSENIGTADIHVLNIELKAQPLVPQHKAAKKPAK